MTRIDMICAIRAKLAGGGATVGSWMQIPNGSVAEIMGRAGYDWVALDLEHGSIDVQQLPDLCRALELGGTLPLVRLAHGAPKDVKRALDAGAGGVIVPMVTSAQQLRDVRRACSWPPSGDRGVGFSRANLFGKDFDAYRDGEAQTPLFVAMIENTSAIDDLPAILQVEGLDAILIGPYDLSSSMGLIAQFDAPEFSNAMARMLQLAADAGIPAGVHVVQPSRAMLDQRLREGYRFIAYSIDSVFLVAAAEHVPPSA